MKPRLHLSIQYSIPRPRFHRHLLKCWVLHALNAAYEDRKLRFTGAKINLCLVDEHKGRVLNYRFRGKSSATNVLTFEYGVDYRGIVHSDIAICVPVLLCEARAQQKKLEHHAAHLTVHGVLHALGYNHILQREATDMEALEVIILTCMGIPHPYIV